MNIFQVDTKFITTAYSQPMNLVQTEPELTVQLGCQNRVCNDPKRKRNQQSHLASSSSGCFLVTEHSLVLIFVWKWKIVIMTYFC